MYRSCSARPSKLFVRSRLLQKNSMAQENLISVAAGMRHSEKVDFIGIADITSTTNINIADIQPRTDIGTADVTPNTILGASIPVEEANIDTMVSVQAANIVVNVFHLLHSQNELGQPKGRAEEGQPEEEEEEMPQAKMILLPSKDLRGVWDS